MSFSCTTFVLTPFLNYKKNALSTTVFSEGEKNVADCLKYESVCPMKENTVVMKKILERAITTLTSLKSFVTEVLRITWLLTNKNFPKQHLDQKQ